MARDKVKGTGRKAVDDSSGNSDRTDDSATADDSATTEDSTTADGSATTDDSATAGAEAAETGATGPVAGDDGPGEKSTMAKTGGGKSSGSKSGGKRAGRDRTKSRPTSSTRGARGGRSATAASAARNRAVMQRRHLRIGFAMTAAVGVEIAGAAGLVAGSLLAWEWGEPLWGRTEPAWVVVQVALVVAVLALVAAWLPVRVVRSERVQARCRALSLLPAAVVAVVAVALPWQAEPAAREAGPLVTAVAAVLALVGAVGWLLGLRQLRVLFPFGLADARSRGFGNVASVRRAQWVGGPAGAVGGAALVAGALLVTPGWVTTVDTETAEPLALTGDPATVSGDPAWTVELAAGDEGSSSQVWATPGGLLIEETTGVRAVDPRTGEPHWHWRDDAYQRVGGVLTDNGETFVLALTYQGESTGRDRVVALDTGTGELRWDRFDEDLVAAMGTVVVAPEQGDWFVVPEQEAPGAGQQTPSVTLRAVDSDGGQTRWRASEEEGCTFTSASADAAGTVVTTQQCGAPGGAGGGAQQEPPAAASCLLTGVDPASGDTQWIWPAQEGPAGDEAGEEGDEQADAPPAECQAAATPELVLVNYQQEGVPAAVALDPASGEPVWTAPDDDVAGLRNPVMVGDALAGTAWVDEGEGAGHGELVIRDPADGQVRERVVLPDGQPIEATATGDGLVAISVYRQESGEIVLVEADVPAAEVRSETVVAAAPEEGQYRRVTVAAGPDTLAVEALVATGSDPETAEHSLLVYGW